MGCRYTPRAQADIEEVWDYTADRWGVDQADRYIWLIRDAAEGAAGAPGLDRPCDDIRQGYCRLGVQSHALFYQRAGDDVLVVRVLHGRMDHRRHLV